MGGALARAVSRVENTQVLLCDFDKSKAESLANEIGASLSSAEDMTKVCDYIFLGVKPSVLPSVIDEIKESAEKNKSLVLISMAAGVCLEKIGEKTSCPTIRIMPNTPVSVGAGMISWCKNQKVTKDASRGFEAIMAKAGRLLYIEEKLIDAATAVAGCGPAFVYMFIEALADGGVQCGLSRADAITMACETVKGAAMTVLETGKHPEQLKDEVCSPGGSTIVGVHALEDGAFRADTSEAVIAAYQKTKKLG